MVVEIMDLSCARLMGTICRFEDGPSLRRGRQTARQNQQNRHWLIQPHPTCTLLLVPLVNMLLLPLDLLVREAICVSLPRPNLCRCTFRVMDALTGIAGLFAYRSTETLNGLRIYHSSQSRVSLKNNSSFARREYVPRREKKTPSRHRI